MKKTHLLFSALLLSCSLLLAQSDDPVVEAMVKEATENSQLESLAHELLDVVGPRLVGSPQMKAAGDWAVAKYKEWGIDAKIENYGEWRGWERGITHVDMLSPRVQSLQGTQLAWSPSTGKNGVRGEVVTLPKVKNAAEFNTWLKGIKGKIVLTSMPQPTGRPDDNWEEFATPESFEKMKADRDAMAREYRENLDNMGINLREMDKVLEDAGAVAIISSNWSRGFGVNKIFGAGTNKVPEIDIELEDYGMLYRLAESGRKPEIHITAESKELGKVPTFNTIATIPGTEKPDEYVVLSAHFDSWDGATGATDNGTGSITMMEAARLLKKHYPNPKRTIIIGLWGSEEQGLNGSRAFVEDHPEIVQKVQASFNQDNGTGRVVNLNGGGFLYSYDYLGRWLNAVPNDITKHIETSFPGAPATGGSDYASFQAAGAPAFSLSSISWDYWNYTWHTNRDTYDKIVFDDVRNNAILTAILAYKASEDPNIASREQAVLPVDRRTGEPRQWPTPRSPTRSGGMD